VALSVGTRLGPYEVLGPIGVGGMGEVYRARDSRLARDVAIKVILPMFAGDSERIKRFEQEARAAGALSHPNVCAIYDVGSYEGSSFVVMELLEGESLRETLKSGPLPVRKAMDCVAQAAHGLSAAHEKGIIHRDLKPENLFLTKDGWVKVLDFGLAKLTRPEALAPIGEKSTSIAHTETGAILGTVGYMSPEQVRGEAADHRSDLFALGSILYELLTGKRPFHGATCVETLHAILNEEPAPLAAQRPDAPLQLTRIVRHCLAKDPERRLQTSKDVRNELEDLQHELALGSYHEEAAPMVQQRLVERQLVLTTAHVRRLSARNPRLIGYPMVYLDNQIESDTLIVVLHGVGADYRHFEPVLRTSPYRTLAPTLVGFEPGQTNRPVLGMEDHSRLLRILLERAVRECWPKRTILVGFSAGADQYLRMIDTEEGAGIDVTGLVALGPNVSIETCFVSKLYAELDVENPDAMLDVLRSLAQHTRDPSTWPVVHGYVSQTFATLGSELEPLKRYSADVIAPFEQPGDPLAGWFRAAKRKIPYVRFVFSSVEAAPAEELLARHLESNVLGDEFPSKAFVIEPVHHMELIDPKLVMRHIASVLEEAAGQTGGPHA
jgi:pimeloyl-ACP methyl ester carboxylesterase